MGKTYRRPPIKQHKDLREDQQYRVLRVDSKKRKLLARKPTQQDIIDELMETMDVDNDEADWPMVG